MATKKKAGRPTVMTDAVLRKLEHGFSCGLSDREACLYADIWPSTLYEYCENHPEFSERKELLKEQVKMQAKLNLASSISSGDEKASEWYLERKAKDEFSTKTEVSGTIAGAVQIVDDLGGDDDAG